METGKLYRMMLANTAKNYALQAKDKAEVVASYGGKAKEFIKDKAETVALYGLEAQDIVKATAGFGVASIGVRTIADSIKGSRGNDFKITGVSTDPLLNNYTGDKGQIEHAQQSIFNLSNAKNIHYHMDKPLKEILATIEKSQKAGNKDLNDQMRKRIEEATKYFYTILEDMFLNKDSDANKKIKNQAQEILDSSISKGIRESRQMTGNINDAKKEIEKNQPEENRGIHYAKSTENAQPSEVRTNSVNTSVTEGPNLSHTTNVQRQDEIRAQQAASAESDTISDITYSKNEQKITKEITSQQKHGGRRTTTAEAEVQAQRTVNDRSTESNVEIINPETYINESENNIDEQGPFLEKSKSRQTRRKTKSTSVKNKTTSSAEIRQFTGRNYQVEDPITYTKDDNVEHPDFKAIYEAKGEKNKVSRRKNDGVA